MKASFVTGEGEQLQLVVNMYRTPFAGIHMAEFERHAGPIIAFQDAFAAIWSELIESVEAPPS